MKKYLILLVAVAVLAIPFFLAPDGKTSKSIALQNLTAEDVAQLISNGNDEYHASTLHNGLGRANGYRVNISDITIQGPISLAPFSGPWGKTFKVPANYTIDFELTPSAMLHRDYDTQNNAAVHATANIQRLEFVTAWNLPRSFQNTGFSSPFSMKNVSGDLYLGFSDCTVTRNSSVVERYMGFFNVWLGNSKFCIEGNDGQNDFMLRYFN